MTFWQPSTTKSPHPSSLRLQPSGPRPQASGFRPHDYEYDYDYDTTIEITNNNVCSGCVDNQLNQLAHMEPGGCLYDDLHTMETINLDLPSVPHAYMIDINEMDTPEPNVIEVESTSINGIGNDLLGQNWYNKMDDNNKEIMDVFADSGSDAAVKAMFTANDGVSRLSYSEMRALYG